MTQIQPIVTLSLRDSVRQACRSLIKPVCVLTAKCSHATPFTTKGELRGCTVSTFRVLDGSQGLFCMNSDRLFTSIIGDELGINLLHTNQQEVCYRFSQTKYTSEEQFAGIDVRYIEGVPILDQFHTAAIGRVHKTFKTGTSILYLLELRHVLKGLEGNGMFLVDGSTTMTFYDIN